MDETLIDCKPGPRPGDPECEPGCRCADGFLETITVLVLGEINFGCICFSVYRFIANGSRGGFFKSLFLHFFFVCYFVFNFFF